MALARVKSGLDPIPTFLIKYYRVKTRMRKYRIFVSSVQKEMEPERLAVSSLITTDPFLREHLNPVLFDKEPVPGRKASKPYLNCLDSC